MKASTPRLEVGASVHADWFGWLPEAKMNAFHVYANELETRYLMLSVSLNEAIGFRDRGSQGKSYEIILTTPPLCTLLSKSLEVMLRSLAEHVARYGVAPSVAPLDAANFRGRRGQSSARKNSLLSSVLLSQRAQYLNKVGALREMISYLSDDFCHAVEQLSSAGCPSQAASLWAAMDDGHFDLNSCLREAMILLKCFLRVLPNQQLQAFQRTVAAHLPVVDAETPDTGPQEPGLQTIFPRPSIRPAGT